MLNNKFLNISFKTWIIIFLTILYLIFKKKPEDFTSKCSSKKSKIISKSNSVNKSNNKIKVYNFNTLWCSISRDFQDSWDEFSKKNKSDNVDIIDVKCDNDKFKDLCKKYPVPGYPTVLFVKGEKVAEYQGDRTPKDLAETLKRFKLIN